MLITVNFTKMIINTLVKKYYKTILLSIIAICIYITEQNISWVEQYYYGFWYPKISFIQRLLTAWLPFSVGDVFYIFLGGMTVFYFTRNIKNIFYSNKKCLGAKLFLVKGINFILTVLITFKLLWGLNYSRQGIAKQLDLYEQAYCKEELVELTENLIFEANFYRKKIADTALPVLNIDTVFNETKNAYANAAKLFPFLEINNFSLKPSLYSFAGNYLGYTGYYNPFTGEAQIRADIPSILLPFVASHEVAHQLGFASEEEANFVAYLVAKNFSGIYLKYATCLELIDYASVEIFNKYVEDFEPENGIKKLIQLKNCFDPQVKKDRENIKYFFFRNKKNFASLSTTWYDSYLKINYQPNGVESYNQVIGLVLAYLKK